jgi:hypothetical protein
LILFDFRCVQRVRISDGPDGRGSKRKELRPAVTDSSRNLRALGSSKIVAYGGSSFAVLRGMRVWFDRGTLLLDAPKGWQPICNLAFVLWDPRVAAYRAPAFEHARLLTALAKERIQVSDHVRNPLAPTQQWTPLDLRPYQAAASEAWALGGRRGIIVLPTGSDNYAGTGGSRMRAL